MQDSGAPPPRPVWLRSLIGLAVAGCVLFLADAAVFRSGAYTRIADPDSAACHFDRVIRIENARQRDGRKQILVIGDSRALSIRPPLAEEESKRHGVAFSNASLLGSTPRGWYYLLRELDPHARRYDAVVFAVDSYDDASEYAFSESTADVEMPVSALHLRDVFDYPWTFRDPQYRRDAFLECLLTGSAYKQDFQRLLADPAERARKTAMQLQDYAQYYWLRGIDQSLAGLRVDWAARQVKFPASADAQTRKILLTRVQNPPPAIDQVKAALRREWLARIARHYGGSRTLLVFARVPSTPIPFARRAAAPRGIVRDLASQQPNVLLLDEHLFDQLERPENFYDYTHTNGVGSALATKILVDQVPLILERIERTD